jgi:hypothetical protein
LRFGCSFLARKSRAAKMQAIAEKRGGGGFADP